MKIFLELFKKKSTHVKLTKNEEKNTIQKLEHSPLCYFYTKAKGGRAELLSLASAQSTSSLVTTPLSFLDPSNPSSPQNILKHPHKPPFKIQLSLSTKRPLLRTFVTLNTEQEQGEKMLINTALALISAKISLSFRLKNEIKTNALLLRLIHQIDIE